MNKVFIIFCYSECGVPVVSNYTRVYGNQYSVGSRLLLQCEATGMVHASQCLNNGSWSHDEVDIECGKIKMIRIKLTVKLLIILNKFK